MSGDRTVSTLGDEEAGREKTKGEWGRGSWGKNERKERRGTKEICGLVGRGLGEEERKKER
jgi:hypothetical protein